jgi:AMP-binding enzyme
MILRGTQQAGGDRVTLDDLFRRAGVRRSDALALIDPPNVETITGAAPRRLTYAEADRAISALAARLRGLGLPTDAVVAIQLANTVDSVIALLGVLRAGLIAAPLPLLWRKQEMVTALSRAGAKSIITSARIGAHPAAETAMQVAAELFPVRHVCGFGRDLPDGLVSLNHVFTAGPVEFFQPPARPGNAGAHIAVITFDIAGDGIVPVARSHSELIAGGIAAFLQGGIAKDTAILSVIPLGSFAGIALGLMPWLLGAGTLALHHGFDAAVFAEQCRAHDIATVVLAGPALEPLADAGLLVDPIKSILALWRAPERLAGAMPWRGDAALVDLVSFGEIGFLPARRGTDCMPAPIRHGVIATPRDAASAIAALETTRTKSGTLALRGPMVPAHDFPPGAAQGNAAGIAPDGFIDTAFACRLNRAAGTIVLTGPPAGITTVGGYRFRQGEVDAVVADADRAAIIAALPDATLGQRLAGRAGDAAATAVALQARGVNSLIAGAFRARAKSNAA